MIHTQSKYLIKQFLKCCGAAQIQQPVGVTRSHGCRSDYIQMGQEQGTVGQGSGGFPWCVWLWCVGRTNIQLVYTKLKHSQIIAVLGSKAIMQVDPLIHLASPEPQAHCEHNEHQNHQKNGVWWALFPPVSAHNPVMALQWKSIHKYENGSFSLPTSGPHTKKHVQ